MAENQHLLELVQDKAKKWLSSEYDKETQKKVQSLLNNEDSTELIESFYKNLEFGTGGLRGIMGVGTNRMNEYTVAMATQGLANYLKKSFPNQELAVVIAYDCRHNSPLFAQITANVFSGNGIKVYLFSSLRPTPEVSFAIRHLGCQSGVMITASHNPKIYNGYKAYWEDGAQMTAPHDKNTIAEVNRIKNLDEVIFEGNTQLIESIDEEIDRLFIDKIQGLSLAPEIVQKHSAYPIVYTPIHGTGVEMVPRALKSFGFQNIINVPEQDVISGDFPTVISPNPEESAALQMALQKAEETKAQLVLASDPDADRLGVAFRNNQGKMQLLNGNQICTLLVYYSIIRRKELGLLTASDFIVKTIVTTDLIQEICQEEGVTLFNCYTGFKWIALKIKELEAKAHYIGGGEESYGFLWEDFIRDKNSVSACALFSELTVWALEKNLSIEDLLNEIYCKYGYFAEKGHYIIKKGRTGAEEIQQMMHNYRNSPWKELAGSPVVAIIDYQSLEYWDLIQQTKKKIEMPEASNVLQYICQDGSKLSIRPSGTEPKIKYYISIQEKMSSNQELNDVKKKAEQRIQNVLSSL